MNILTIVNISNLDDIESDSGYIFNYLLADEFVKNEKNNYFVILPKILRNKKTRFENWKIYYANIGTTKYESRYSFDWYNFKKIIKDSKPDVIFLNQCELASALKSMLLTISMEHIKIISYCHYPALHRGDNDEIILDYSLNNSGLCQNIVMNILSSVNISDTFIIQSDFARKMILNFAEKHNYFLNKNIEIIPPPYDPYLCDYEKTENPRIKKILYNHRLYESYGTDRFLKFVVDNDNLKFIVSDPMPNRKSLRGKFNNTPVLYRKKLFECKNVELVDGGQNRELYKQYLNKCHIGMAPYRKACVWSMAAIDCLCAGIPVVAPNFAAYKEFIHPELLYDNEIQLKKLIEKLFNNEDFYLKVKNKSEKILEDISPFKTSKKILNLMRK
ncbi:MAG: hypothetical protein LBI80_04685 [Endomicrobium sp.]|jgi:hypothetical protein|nr:hypothetical protein [Endomicrobium sp.]